MLFALLTILPLLTDQVGRLVAQAPELVAALRDSIQQFQVSYVSWMNPEYLQQLVATVVNKMQEWGGSLLSVSIASIPGLITLLVYVILVPVLIFFLLKDKTVIVAPTQHNPKRSEFGMWHGISATVHLLATIAATCLVVLGGRKRTSSNHEALCKKS